MPPRILLLLAFAVVPLAVACSSDDVDAGPTASVETTDNTGSDEPASDEPVSDGAGSGPVGEQTAAVTVVGDRLSVMPPRVAVSEPANDPAIGQRAPEISGTDFSGSPVEIVADGTPRVVMFVAHWCPHCQREIPVVKQLVDDGALPDGLELIVVSTAVREDSENYPPESWLRDEGWPGPVLRDSEELDGLKAFGLGGFPFSVYLNGDHEVVTRSAGAIPAEILQQLWLATVNG